MTNKPKDEITTILNNLDQGKYIDGGGVDKARQDLEALFQDRLSKAVEEAQAETEENVFTEIEETYGKHKIPKDWLKLENVHIWFEAFHRGIKWRGIPGYVYQKSDGTYIAPFRGELIPVIKDAKNEYRQAIKNNLGGEDE